MKWYVDVEQDGQELGKRGAGQGGLGGTKLFRLQLAVTPSPCLVFGQGPRKKESFRAWHGPEGLVLTSETRVSFTTNPTTTSILLGHDILCSHMQPYDLAVRMVI